MNDPTHVLLLVNSSSRTGAENYEQIANGLEASGFVLVKHPKAECDEFDEIIRSHRGAIDLVVLGGGDGTVRSALKALLETKIPFGIVPLGTANNLARSLGIDATIEAALQVIATGARRRIDLASANGEYFLNVAGMGLSTQVNQHVPSDMKRRFGVLAYIWYAFKILTRFRPFSAKITTSDFVRVVRTMQITVCNGRHYGSGLTIAHDASIDDGRLDLCSTEIKHWWKGFKLVPAFLTGRYDGRNEIRLVQGEEIRIETRKPMPIDIDGELLTKTPAVFKVLPQALEVIAPVAIVQSALQVAGDS